MCCLRADYVFCLLLDLGAATPSFAVHSGMHDIVLGKQSTVRLELGGKESLCVSKYARASFWTAFWDILKVSACNMDEAVQL